MGGRVRNSRHKAALTDEFTDKTQGKSAASGREVKQAKGYNVTCHHKQ